MKTKHLMALLAATIAATGRLHAADPVKTVLITANDQMKYSVTHIDAHPGQPIHVQLKNEGTLPKEVMGHNWVLLKAGFDPMAYATSALPAVKENFEPKALAGQVLASISLLGARHEGEVTFNAPETPGTYFFLCSFPAHCQSGMRGELVVK